MAPLLHYVKMAKAVGAKKRVRLPLSKNYYRQLGILFRYVIESEYFTPLNTLLFRGIIMVLSDLLKERTKKSHQELEKLIINKINMLTSVEAYAVFLKVFYGYIAPIESSLVRILDTSVIPDLKSRRKSDLLLDDIHFFNGRDDEEVAPAKDLPAIETIAEALGAMYVLEGSTLGGKYIVRMISARLSLEPEHGFSFFNGYKENTELMWSNFKDKLNIIGEDLIAKDQVIGTANQTFEKFKQWIDEQ